MSSFTEVRQLESRRDPAGSAVIVVVERDPHVRELEQYFLEKAGYQVAFAGDGTQGLEKVHELRPRIVVTEILLPGLDGLSMCRRIKQDPHLTGTSVLVFSILAASARARDAGADAFVHKALAGQKLVETVDRLLSPDRER